MAKTAKGAQAAKRHSGAYSTARLDRLIEEAIVDAAITRGFDGLDLAHAFARRRRQFTNADLSVAHLQTSRVETPTTSIAAPLRPVSLVPPRGSCAACGRRATV